MVGDVAEDLRPGSELTKGAAEANELGLVRSRVAAENQHQVSAQGAQEGGFRLRIHRNAGIEAPDAGTNGLGQGLDFKLHDALLDR